MRVPTTTEARAHLNETLAAISPASPSAREQARKRHVQLTKPPGSLGRLEELGIRLASIAGTERPEINTGVVIIMAADHGVTVQGVSPYPSEVTQQMMMNFGNGGAAINAIAGVSGVSVHAVDVGVNAPGVRFDYRSAGGDSFGPELVVETRRVRHGTADMTCEPALTPDEVFMALGVGIEVVREEVAREQDIIMLGEMGIGNTTSASALTAALIGCPPRVVTGPGTGLPAEQVGWKVQVIERALDLHAAVVNDPLGALAAVGGLELAGLAGVVLGAAARRVPVLLDGFITSAAALAAVRLAPRAADYLIAAHRSPEPGHTVLLGALGLEPLLNLGLRLGEGTGAAAAYPLLRQAAAVLRTMSTFAEAEVSNRKTRTTTQAAGEATK